MIDNVTCCDCGKEFETFVSENIQIPKFRCDNCLKRK